MIVERYTLPNGLDIQQININETNFMFKEIFEDNVYFMDKVKLNEGDVVFDVGANIGMFSVFLGQKNMNLKQYAFEPISDFYEVLHENMTMHCKDSKPYNVGFSNTNKKEIITFYPNNSIMSSVYADKETDEQCFMETVFSKEMSEEEKELFLKYKDQLLEGRFEAIQRECTMITLSDFIKDNQIEQINLLKMDAEKSEVDILNGLGDEWGKIEQFVIEVHGDYNLQEVTRLLEEHGYSCIINPCCESETLFMLFASKKI